MHQLIKLRDLFHMCDICSKNKVSHLMEINYEWYSSFLGHENSW